jgi:hypothetical protein
MEILKRAREGFTYWLEKPELTDSKVVDFLMSEFGVTKTTAYNDLFGIKKLLGNVRNAAKEWNRYTVVEMCKKAYKVAEAQDDAKGMAMAADKIGKYTKCDQNENEEIPWERIAVPNFEPVPDITVLADMDKRLTPIEEEHRQKLRAKYKGLEATAEEAEIIE